MKKRVLAAASAIVMVITMLSAGGLSLFAAEETSGATSTGLYDVYANGGKYGMEAVSSSGVVLQQNGDNATAIGGNYGVGIKRPEQTNHDFIIDATTAAANIVDWSTNAKVTHVTNTAGTTAIGNKGFTSSSGTATFGGTLVLKEGITALTLYFVSYALLDANTNQLKLWASDEQNGTYRQLTVKKTYMDGMITTWKAYAFEPADYSEILPTDNYFKFEFTKPNPTQSEQAYHLGKVSYSCENSYVQDAFTFDALEIGGLVPSISETAAITVSSLNANVSPSTHNVRFKQNATAGTTMELLFTSKVEGLGYDIADIQVHVSLIPDYKSYTWPVTLAVSNTPYGPFETVEVLTTLEDSRTGWCTDYCYSFADPSAVVTEHVRYVKFNLTVPDIGTGVINTSHINITGFEYFYAPRTTDVYTDELTETEQSFIINASTVAANMVDLLGESYVAHIANTAGLASIGNKGFTAPDGAASFGGTLVLKNNITALTLYITTNATLDIDTDYMQLWASDAQSGMYRPLTVRRIRIDDMLSQRKVYAFEPADTSEILPTDKYFKFEFTKPKASDVWHAHHLDKVSYAYIDPYVKDSFTFERTDVNTFMPQLTNAFIHTNNTNLALSPYQYNVRFSTSSVTPGSSMELLFSSEELGYDLSNIRVHLSLTPDSIYDAANWPITLSVSETKDGTYEPVEVLRTLENDRTSWALDYFVSVANPSAITTKQVRYVKFTLTYPSTLTSNIDRGHINISEVDFLHAPAATKMYDSNIVYRVPNATDFTAQFNFLAGAFDNTGIRAFTANADRDDDWREITLESVAGKLADAPTPTATGSSAAWEA
ncbi:MAG: hypothetical protein PHE79_10530 [Eubacteriales bacterium]|nr:hypothetical protein [Eubacteriales bacterium]